MHYYAAGGVMALALWPLCARLAPSMPHTALIAVCGAAVYILMLVLQRDEFFLTNARNVLRKLKFCQ